MTATRTEIAATMDEAQWEWLRAHLERGGVIVVSQDIDLVDAAVAIAEDDSQKVGDWIAGAKIGKPSAVDIAAWNADPAKLFRMIVVSPYVLIQEKTTLQ